jgi:hypothetical protein
MEYSWKDLEESGQYRPKYPDSPFMHIADLVNPKTGKTYREENSELTHTIPIGSLVEDIETGIRLFVVMHTRDCDQTPLYSLAADMDDPDYKWHHGYSEDSLRIVKGIENDTEGFTFYEDLGNPDEWNGLPITKR